ncbi:MAG: IMS domain-containing protein [Prochlorococcaceae cyanobacterium]
MELPIDHFRLLGVSPTTDAQTVLRTLQQRLDRVPDQGFTYECLEARAHLLRTTADLLTDEPRRRHYEDQLLALADEELHAQAALEVASSHEVGGLLLLLEAGQPQEVFEQAERCLQPPRAPSLGSGREADLALLAGLASQQGAQELRQQRRYEAASQMLSRGLQLLQRMGQCSALRERMARERDELLPYRILDLLSRDLSAAAQRQEGLALLEQLVQLRGGLDAETDLLLRREEFEAFLGQIRSFLTLQEQLDLFSRWAEAGSLRAERLATQALVASGFAQRKPERIAAALERLSQQGAAARPVDQACLLLLLGDVDQAETLFREGAPEALRGWAASQGEDLLAQLCAVCRDWLAREVLSGYRDLEAEPDLEAYFADRDVQTYVESQDRRRRRARGESPRPSVSAAAEPAAEFLTPAVPAAGAPAFVPPLGESQTPEWDLTRDPRHAFSADLGHHPLDAPLPEDPAGAYAGAEGAPARSSARRHPAPHALAVLRRGLDGLPLPVLLAVGAAMVASLVAAGWWLWRPTAPAPQPEVAGSPAPPAPGVTPPAAPAPAPKPAPVPPAAPAFPLQAAAPDEAELQGLLQAWLDAKAAVLAGETPKVPLEAVARSSRAAEVSRERSRDEAGQRHQKIEASIRSVRVAERTPQRIVLVAALRYSDQLLSTDGTAISRTEPFDLTNTYVFARQDGAWRLASFHRGG